MTHPDPIDLAIVRTLDAIAAETDPTVRTWGMEILDLLTGGQGVAAKIEIVHVAWKTGSDHWRNVEIATNPIHGMKG